jgi:hypothetical protein
MDQVEGRTQRSDAAPARHPWRGLALALALLLGATAPADAQVGSRIGRPRDEAPQKAPDQTPQQTPKPPEVVPEPWPRLEIGALLCKSRDGLVKYQTQLADGANAAAAAQASDCHPLRKQTGIQILDRDGPSRTQIVTTDETKETGWTNTYLPPTPPPGAKTTGTGK